MASELCTIYCCFQLLLTAYCDSWHNLLLFIWFCPVVYKFLPFKLIFFLKKDHHIATACGPVHFGIQMNWLVSVICTLGVCGSPFLTYFVIYCVARTFHMHKFVKSCATWKLWMVEDSEEYRYDTGVLRSPLPDLLPDVFCLMVRIFCLMLVLLYI